MIEGATRAETIRLTAEALGISEYAAEEIVAIELGEWDGDVVRAEDDEDGEDDDGDGRDDGEKGYDLGIPAADDRRVAPFDGGISPDPRGRHEGGHAPPDHPPAGCGDLSTGQRTLGVAEDFRRAGDPESKLTEPPSWKKDPPPSRQALLRIDPANPYSLPSGAPIRSLTARMFRGQRAEIRAWLKATTSGPTSPLPPAIPPDLFRRDDPVLADALYRRLHPYWEAAGRSATEALGGDPDGYRPDAGLIRDRAAFAAASIQETTRAALQAKLDALRSADPPGTAADLDRAIREVFAHAIDHRAELIARTETSDAVHAAALDAAVLDGAEGKTKAWLLDGNPCEICIGNAAAGAIPIGAKFPSGHLHPTSHARCACSLRIDGARKFAPDLPSYGPSKATVRHTDYEESDILAAARSTYGRDVTLRDIASTVGAPDDARVNVAVGESGLDVFVNGPGYSMARSIRRAEATGKLRVENHAFYVEPDRQGKGIGAGVFGRQVEQAARLGVAEVHTFAAKGATEFGYHVWPRFGYDGPIPDRVRPILPASLAGASRLSDLMKTPEGREWWKTNGVGVDMTFDLADGSPSRRAWDGYRAEKAAAKGGEPWEAEAKAAEDDAGPAESPQVESPDFTDEDIAASDRAWDRIAGLGPAVVPSPS